MKPTRLFVGGLSEGVKEKKLISKFSPYGSVIKAEIKEKTDAEGNVTLRFAYVNIESSNDQLENCVSTLNGCSWKGSQLRVEVAKESFLDRLKREQAERKEREGATYQAKVEEKTDVSRPKQYQVIQNEKKRKYEKSTTPGVLVEGSTYFIGDSKQKTKNVREEKMLESFKMYSSFWADSDDEEEEQDTKEIEMKDTKTPLSREEYVTTLPNNQDKKQNWGFPSKASNNQNDKDGLSKKITRYDPTRQEHQQFRLSSSASVEMKTEAEESQEPKKLNAGASKPQKQKRVNVDDTLNASQDMETVCSSLLTMFNQAQAEVKEEDSVAEPVRVEKKTFFLKPDDDRILGGLKWMRECDQDEMLRKFSAVEGDLYNVIKTRSIRANHESIKRMDPPVIYNTYSTNEEKKSFEDVSSIDCEDEFYDYGWRLAKQEKRNEKEGKESSNKDGDAAKKDSVCNGQSNDDSQWTDFHPGTRGGRGWGNFRGRGVQRGGRNRGRGAHRGGRNFGGRSGVRKFTPRDHSVRSS